jgi:hypothetical protein
MLEQNLDNTSSNERTLHELKKSLTLFGSVGDQIILSYLSHKKADQTAQELNVEVDYVRNLYVQIERFFEKKGRGFLIL